MFEKVITIFGTSKAKEGDGVFELAYQFGRLCAEAGFAIANGGYKGIMLASAKGAKSAGGKTFGVTCTAFGKKVPTNSSLITLSLKTSPKGWRNSSK
jgi:uncharacterized protein (TIGR00725 family)